jgi:uncharacterized tellurite resistance protein B-like protein
MRSLFKLLGLEPESARVRDPRTVERIAAQLDELGPRARYVAAFAYVLARVAHADLSISEDEVDVMEKMAGESAGLSPEQARVAIEIARGQTIELGGTENYMVTRLFREVSTPDERLGVIECLFAVAAADDEISTAENHEISKIGSELGLSHAEITIVRSRYREHLAVLKGLPS